MAASLPVPGDRKASAAMCAAPSPRLFVMRTGTAAVHMRCMTKKREDLDMTAIVDAAFNSLLESKGLTRTLGPDVLSAGKIEQLKRSMIQPIWHAIPAIIAALEEKPVETDEEILAGFNVPDSLDGLLS